MNALTDSAWLNQIKAAFEALPLPPAFFWTFTFERELKVSRAKHYVRRYFQLLAKHSGTDLFTIASLGIDRGTRIHSHGCLCVRDIKKIKKEFIWTHGLQEWSDYDCNQGGIIYSIYGGRNKHAHYPFQVKACCANASDVSQLTYEMERALLLEQERSVF